MERVSELRLSSGVVVHTWAPAAPRGIVLVQHGYGEYAHRYVSEHGQFVGRLLRAGFEVWAMDLWGHGDSPGRRGVTDVQLAVRDHVEMRRAARARELPVLLVGHSLGGLVTAGSVAADPSGLAGVVLTGSALPSEPRLVRRTLGLLAKVAPSVSIPVPRSPLSGLSHEPDVVARTAADPRMTHRQVPMVLAVTALDVMDGVRTQATRWLVPTLVLHGGDDIYTESAGSRALLESIAADDKMFREVPGGRHELFHDSTGHTTVTEVVAWLADRSHRAATSHRRARDEV